MTSRNDLPRLGASLGVLGTILERDGQTAWDRMDGWQHGPRKAPEIGVRGGGGGEAGAEDRKDEAIQRAMAARHFQAFRGDLNQIDELVQSILRRIDVACPPNPEDVKNRRTGDLDPVTSADVAVAGWCASCWRNDQQMVVIEVHKRSGLRYFRDYCRWCGGVKSTYGIEPPLEMLKLHHAGRRINVTDLEAAVKAIIDAQPKSKKAQRKAKRKAKAA